MPFLDWKNSGDSSEVTPHLRPNLPKEKQLTIQLDEGRRAELVLLLEQALIAGVGELRLELPGNWTVFWKPREGETRLLLAHPEPETWVATAALGPECAKMLVSRLKTLMMGETLLVSELGPMASFSNLEIVIRIG